MCVCVCVCVCIHTHTHTHIYIYIYICLLAQTTKNATIPGFERPTCLATLIERNSLSVDDNIYICIL